MDSQTESAAPRRKHAWRDVVLALVRWTLVLWALALVFYFQYREGLVNWPWLQEGYAGTLKALSPGLAPSDHARAAQSVLGSLLTGGWHIWWENVPWVELAWSTLSLALMIGLGYAILGCLDLFLSRGAHVCMAFVVGLGVSGVAFELLTMAHLLSRWPVVTCWIVLLGGATLCAVLRRTRLEASLGERRVIASYGRRLSLARQWMRASTLQPRSLPAWLYFGAALLLMAVISVLTLLHGVGTPETYWDSLILYMGYARKMFLEQSFPRKVVGQVGIGLGANYPHLYALLTAQTAAMAGYWSDSFAQLLPPVAGVVATLLVYYTALELTRHRMIALSAALLFRAVPYGIIYSQYASDYAVAILLTAAFLFCALKYVVYGLPSYLALLWLVAGAAVHVNYLMGALWIIAAVVVVVAHLPGSPLVAHETAEPEPEFDEFCEEEQGGPRLHELTPPVFMFAEPRAGLLDLLRRRWFWGGMLAGLALGVPWYIRNTLVTGNPVYAFFYNIFPSLHVNPDVMRSASVEWLLNGDGVGRVGRTLGEKLANSWLYFVTGPQHWKLAPVFMALVVPGVLVFAARLLGTTLGGWVSRRAPSPQLGRRLDDSLRFGLVAAALFFLLWFYEYVIADFYLYHIIIVLPLFGVFACYVFEVCRTRVSRSLLYALCLVVGFSPGIVMGLMGFKLKRGGVYGGRPFSQLELTALKNLFMEKSVFYRMEYDGDMETFARLSQLPPGTVVLTHENRHLLLSEDLKIMHLDDWDVQKAYGKPAARRVALLDRLGVKYYLYVPNEDKHIANSWLGMDELIGRGDYREVFRSPSSGSSERGHLNYHAIPENMNVLYERADGPKQEAPAEAGAPKS